MSCLPYMILFIMLHMISINTPYAAIPTLLQANIIATTPMTAQVPMNGMVTVQYQVTIEREYKSTITRPYIVTPITRLYEKTSPPNPRGEDLPIHPKFFLTYFGTFEQR